MGNIKRLRNSRKGSLPVSYFELPVSYFELPVIFWPISGRAKSAQLIISSPHRGVYIQNIDDWPRYKYRGLLMDTSRHFFPLPVLKAIITSLSWLKMNVFHWHMTG